MQQFEEAERGGRGIRGGCNALWPAWYWLTVLDAFRYTGMRLNQLLHIRLGGINLSEGYLELCLEGSKTHREWRVPVVSALKPWLHHLIEKSTELGAGNGDYLFDVNRIQLKRHVAWDAAKVHQKIRSFFPASVERVWFHCVATPFSPYAGDGTDEIAGTNSSAGKAPFGAPEHQYNYGVCGAEDGYRWKNARS